MINGRVLDRASNASPSVQHIWKIGAETLEALFLSPIHIDAAHDEHVTSIDPMLCRATSGKSGLRSMRSSSKFKGFLAQFQWFVLLCPTL